jgi:hypothetical protein
MARKKVPMNQIRSPMWSTSRKGKEEKIPKAHVRTAGAGMKKVLKAQDC